ncbi:Sodium/hydrogen exchanger family-domain-containing protein [Apiosordaria backusii]|uniref:Sodium/hydrogen exchanger family-domain-containing protein n=1 Tax=Apiosordaria backusii TaxID=314023 RepID=A0AA40EMY8_9PEZI|nr:Sodium/hydrogen exchanger family-domain-containing protein [Apiosordaria backusii]
MAGGELSGNGTGAPPQAGVLEGVNPIEYTPSNPITLFIIQAIIVIIFCQLLSYPLRWLHQPRVIAEVLGGILLGPSVMMRIPGFEATIFPPASMPVFNNVANLGLIIFLFLVALEVDIRLFTQNWKAALSVGMAGMILPFGLGFAIAWGLYKEFHVDESIGFGVFGLFIGTALAITAFPVLCRILSELNLLRSGVGVTVLAAGIGNDVTGWVLLALCVALTNNGSGLAALWALLCCIGWTLFLIFAVRPPFIWILRRTGSLHNGPTQGMVALTLLMVLASSWFTGIIGVHPIFGAFLVGLICPHDGGFAIKLTEKIEDLISVLFLPLYFALSGLKTNLGLLNDGVTWGYCIGVIVCAFAGKIIGGTLAARANKLLWRESFTIGALMSCKGLVELIVLNIGYQAGILSETTFSMFVVMALVTTVATTPMTKLLYPNWYQKKVERWRKGEIDWDGNPLNPSESLQGGINKGVDTQIRRLMVHLRLDSLPSLFTFITILKPESVSKKQVESETPEGESAEVIIKKRPLEVHGMRILELTDRTSSVMHLTEGEDFYSLRDPVVNAFRTFSQLNDVAVSGRVAVVPAVSYAETIVSQAHEVSSDFALIPWGESGSMSEDQSFPVTADTNERFKSITHIEFINQTLEKASTVCNTGIFIDNGFGGITKPVDRPELKRTKSAISIRNQADIAHLPVANKSHHIFFPFFGGADDRVALRIVLQLAKNPDVSATIIRINSVEHDKPATAKSGTASTSTTPEPTTAEDNSETNKTVVASSTPGTATPEADAEDRALYATLKSSLPQELATRVTFGEAHIAVGKEELKEIVVLAQQAVGNTRDNAGDVVVLGRRNAKKVAAEGNNTAGVPDLKNTVGEVAERLITTGIRASLLVIQAGGRGHV